MSDIRLQLDQWRTQRKQKLNFSIFEIEKTVKKAAEGCNLVGDWWSMLAQKPCPYVKPKLEGSIRAEIRRLRHYRDLMKLWIACDFLKNNDIVATISGLKKQIETQMAQWKGYEKVSKRKAYSEVALSVDSVDPFQKKCNDVNDWFVRSIYDLGVQIDLFEAELESLSAIKKKKISQWQQERVDKLSYVVGKHKYHVWQLEKLLRTFDNLSYDDNGELGIVYEEEDIHNFIDKVTAIKEDIDYYIESNMDTDFHENLFIYEDLMYICDRNYLPNTNLSQLQSEQASGNPLKVLKEPSFSVPNSGHSSANYNVHCSSNLTITLEDARKRTNFFGPKNEMRSEHVSKNSSNSIFSKPTNEDGSWNGNSTVEEDFEKSKPSTSKRHGEVPGEGSDVHNECSINVIVDSTVPMSATWREYPPLSPISTASSADTEIIPVDHKSKFKASIAFKAKEPERYKTPPPPPIKAGTSRSFADAVKKSQKEYEAELRMEATNNCGGASSSGTLEGFVPPILGALPFDRVPLSPREMQQSSLLAAAFNHMPHREDSVRKKPMVPQNPCETPCYYPQAPLNVINLENYYARLEVETLLFIFYFGEGSRGQLQASRELKGRGWQYHKKYRTWFASLGDPALSAVDFEQGPIIYFDVDSWSAYKREKFASEYLHIDASTTFGF